MNILSKLDAGAARNTHAAIHDALRLCKVL